MSAKQKDEAEARDVHVFGVRHHGPGSARSLVRALERLEPDVVLVEGPPDADEVVGLLAHEEMRPPVAILVYAPDTPRRAVYYPFATFSPEYQAIRHALGRGVPVRFMDLPQTHAFAISAVEEAAKKEPPEPASEDAESTEPEPGEPEPPSPRADPLGWLARAAGYGDGERWWEHMVEHRRDGEDLFEAIAEAMASLREASPEGEVTDERREAHMRQTIRAARREGFRRIAVVCGAWHAPALSPEALGVPAAKDAATLKGLPKEKVVATWVPWTYGRLATQSGYGAGVESPGWYDHLWTAPDRVAIRWVARVARLLRDEDLDASSASVIEAVRLAETLAALRDRALPGLAELDEAVLAVLCAGGDAPMRLVHERLVTGEQLGHVPDETPAVPLARDLAREQKRLRLAPEASERALDLDLRKPNDLDRSRLLHRLLLLGVPWGALGRATGKAGTFHEIWRLQWAPELAVGLIEAAVWGTTVATAAATKASDAAEKAVTLPELTVLLDRVLLADLPEAAARVTARIEAEAGVASDVTHLMAALPPLANVLRYGNVRKTDAAAVEAVVDGLVARVAIGLPGACASLDDDAAARMFDLVVRVNDAVVLLRDDEHRAAWIAALEQTADRDGVHGVVAGRCARLLLDLRAIDADEAARRLGLALSRASEPAAAAAWVEGLLKGSGLVLLHDDALWGVLDAWVAGLAPEAFDALVPLLRRTFSTFSRPERRQIGERARTGPAPAGSLPSASADLDEARADAALATVARLLGIDV